MHGHGQGGAAIVGLLPTDGLPRNAAAKDKPLGEEPAMALVVSTSSNCCTESAMACEVQHCINFATMYAVALRMDHICEQ